MEITGAGRAEAECHARPPRRAAVGRGPRGESGNTLSGFTPIGVVLAFFLYLL